ncbi:3-deoxy-D-manno-octulosonic acid kinase [Vibrio scophthalmi]|uniref:3-deoxy-D-manno-octulosonic acid kinase n=1 Tax=Vibrio scophthalmi TaxID=45658 RepID=UPI003B52EABA
MMNTKKLPKQQLWFDDKFFDDIHPYYFEASYWQNKDKVVGSALGRGTTWFVNVGSTHAALRHYRRGGLLGKIVRDQYLFRGWELTRSHQELRVLERLKSAGVNVPAPIAARAVKVGVTYRADILVERIPGARDLVSILKERPLPKEVYRHIGQMIAKMHTERVNHTDLNIHNILIDENAGIWLIDFDKCNVQKGSDWMAHNLKRLKRSFYKEVKRFNILWSESDWQFILQGYQSVRY